MLSTTSAIVILALLGIVSSQASLPTPDAELIVTSDVGSWFDGDVNTTIDSLSDFDRIQGVREDQLALQVGPGKYSILRRVDSGECLADILNCVDKQISYTFWLNVQQFKGSGTEYIFRTAALFSESGLSIVVLSRHSTEFRILFRGNELEYEILVPRSEVLQRWTYMAIVADANIDSVKVYLNGTALPDVEPDEYSTSRSGRVISIGQSTQVPDLYYIADIKIFYTALNQSQLQDMFQDTLDGEVISTDPPTTTELPVETESTTTTVIASSSTSTDLPPTSPTTVQTASTSTQSTTTQTVPPTTTMETPITTSTSMPDTSSCDQVSQEYTEQLDKWKVYAEKYIEAMEDWKEMKNKAGLCQ